MRPVFKWIHEKDSSFFNLFNWYWTYEIYKPDFSKPCIWVEHGIPDDNICNQLYEKSYYFCGSLNTYNYLKDKGYKAYYTGSIITDDIYIDSSIKNKGKLVYIPYHPTSKEFPLASIEELNHIAKKYNCNGILSSSIDDMERLPPEYNSLHSSRYEYKDHFAKCTYLLSNAKCVYVEQNSSFSNIANNYGIRVIYRNINGFIYNKLRMFNDEPIVIWKDRNSRERILRALNDIRNIERV